MSGWPRLRPGWYLLAALAVYAVVVTLLFQGSRAELAQLRSQQTVTAQGGAPSAAASSAVAATSAPAASAPAPSSGAIAGLWFPIPGAGVPKDTNNLPGASRPYRHGVSQGFDFASGDAGIPIAYGQPVVAAADGEIVRADTDYVEMTPDTWKQLLDAVSASGADASQLDRLRGRQIWERLPDGRVLRYGFLSGVRDGIRKGIQVYRGEVIGYVGNSGTGDGVGQTELHPRLHFEIWKGDSFFGEGLTPDEVRMQAASLFVGP